MLHCHSEKEGRKTIKDTCQADIDRADPWVSELDYLMFFSRALFLWKWRGGLCLHPSVWTPPFSILYLRGRQGRFWISISWAAMSLKQLSPGSSWCLQQLLNLLLAKILNGNVWLESVPSGFCFLFVLFSNRNRICSARQNQNACVLIVANKLICASMLLKSCPIICGGKPPWHYMTKAPVSLRARSRCTIHETEVNNDGSSKQLPYNIKTKSWMSENMRLSR